MTDRTSKGIDHHVARRIRERRIMLGLTQQQLAGKIGVTYQQAHKYEAGTNRISAARLFAIAQALNVPVTWFFEGADHDAARPTTPRDRLMLEQARDFAAMPPREQAAVRALTLALIREAA